MNVCTAQGKLQQTSKEMQWHQRRVWGKWLRPCHPTTPMMMWYVICRQIPEPPSIYNYGNYQLTNLLNIWTFHSFFFSNCGSLDLKWSNDFEVKVLILALTCVHPFWPGSVGTEASSLSSYTVQELADYKKSWVLHWMCNFLFHFKSNLLEYSAKTITNVSLYIYLWTGRYK